jgi:hypothetical protein
VDLTQMMLNPQELILSEEVLLFKKALLREKKWFSKNLEEIRSGVYQIKNLKGVYFKGMSKDSLRRQYLSFALREFVGGVVKPYLFSRGKVDLFLRASQVKKAEVATAVIEVKVEQKAPRPVMVYKPDLGFVTAEKLKKITAEKLEKIQEDNLVKNLERNFKSLKKGGLKEAVKALKGLLLGSIKALKAWFEF